MRLIPLLTAALVCAVLYLLILERDWLMSFARGEDVALADALPDPADEDAAPVTPQPVPVVERGVQGITDPIKVVALRSTAREIDSAVILRGQTEAAREVDVITETSGTVINTPLRKGATVEEGDVLCELDPGTRQDTLEEALARLAEAKARVPEAEARLAEARAALPAAEARIAEAEAAVPAARAGLLEAQAGVPAARARLLEAQARVPEAEARLAEARAAVPAARARLAEAEARLPEAKARLREAEARVEEARIGLNAAEKLAEGGFASDTRVAAARAAMESALAGVQTAQSQFKAAEAGVENAKSQVESAKAAIASAESGVQNARAGIANAKSQIEGALARIESAKGQVESAKAGIIAAKSQRESAQAGISSAASGIENAKAGIQSAEAAVASARREISRLKITAPFGGLLESDTAEVGTVLNTQGGNAHCATVIQLDPIVLVAFVPETEVARVKVGARAGARLAAGGAEVMGRVTFLARSADETTRTFRVEIEVDNPDLAIGDGQTAEIAIASDGTEAHLLPQSALTLNDEGTLGVRLVGADNLTQFAPVQLLRDTPEGVWLGGLPKEADVIVVGQEFVAEGVPLDPTYREEKS